MQADKTEHRDVIIVGAGISGICAAWHIGRDCPDLSYAVVEARQDLGGTWDLFRYPGIRSDSDLYTFGYSFRPWDGDTAIAEGAEIKDYIRRTADEGGIAPKIRFSTRVTLADWDEDHALWRLTLNGPEGEAQMTCRFLMMCTGYYSYAEGHAPKWDGMEDFTGRIVHPQDWPEDMELKGQRVAVIGSGATAITLVPALAEMGAEVTMIQRSPSYVAALPSQDRFAAFARRMLGKRRGGHVARWKHILEAVAQFQVARRFPGFFRNMLMKDAQKRTGPDFDARTHFTPRYDPWDQRVCVDKDGILFETLREGRARIVTGSIARFTPDGIAMEDGETIPADIVVSATGLKMQAMGGMEARIGGVPVDPHDLVMYKGMMLSGIPNMAYAIGYTNNSWTLRCELIARQVVRILNEMQARGADWVRVTPPKDLGRGPLLNLDAGYITRAARDLPQGGDRAPWKVRQNYVLDVMDVDRKPVVDQAMCFGKATLGREVA